MDNFEKDIIMEHGTEYSPTYWKKKLKAEQEARKKTEKKLKKVEEWFTESINDLRKQILNNEFDNKGKKIMKFVEIYMEDLQKELQSILSEK